MTSLNRVIFAQVLDASAKKIIHLGLRSARSASSKKKFVVLSARIELARPCGHRILSPMRLPISPRERR
jgi:hypothetical protein